MGEETPQQSSDNAVVRRGNGTTDDSKSHFKIVTSSNVLTLRVVRHQGEQVTFTHVLLKPIHTGTHLS